MNFPIPTTTSAPAATGPSFGFPASTVAGAKPPTFSFGTNNAKPLTFGAPATTTATSIPTLTGFGTAPSATTTPLTGGLAGFGAPPAATSTTTAPNLGLSGFGAISSPAITKPSLPMLTGFGSTPASTAVTGSSEFSLPKSTAPALGLGLGSIATSAPTATAAGSGFANLSTATKTTESASVSNAFQMTYNQLEEHINKWTLELEEQEKVFIEQATQINAWDRVLTNNNQKILELNDAVQKVKIDQQMLDQELEFIATQHKELEEGIEPLQKEFLKIPQVDVERSQTYLMVENLDTQLKQMSEDLKEIIDNLNEANKNQDTSDPIIQVGKILNSHMSSLQWIESSTAAISNKLDDISKMHDLFKRDSERSFRSAYYN